MSDNKISKDLRDYEIWTDGGCAPENPGIGGYGIIIVDNTDQKETKIKLQTIVWNCVQL